MYFFTSDEHYFHTNIIRYCNRPFENVIEMTDELIKRHNEVVTSNDITIHAGDFLFSNKIDEVHRLTKRLNGQHYFLRGSHDKWMNINYHEIWEKRIGKHYVVVCHYAMRVWPRSHYNSILLFGHSHGGLNNVIQGKCYDIGVDNNNFYPVSENQIFEIMKDKPDNFNLVKRWNNV